jgi:spermidine/putrescine transport system substrate-binding protein
MNDEHTVAGEPRMTRRRFLEATALAGVGAFLAACGGKGPESASAGAASTTAVSDSATPASDAASPVTAAGKIGGSLNFANWIGYIDISDDGSSYPTLDRFTKETGVAVNYDESIANNEEFFTTLQGPLSQNQPPAWDIIVVTDWLVARLVRLGWLEPITLTATPNFPANLLPQYRGRSFDPDTKFAAPWQSGMTGIGFDKKKTGELTSLATLWDTRFKGKITYFVDEMRDTVGLTAIKLGFDPARITKDQFDAALAEIDRAVKGNLVVKPAADSSYVDALAAGDAVVGMAFSADVLTLLVPDQQPDQDFHFAIATEGGLLWTDNMCMPKGLKNKKQAEAFINFYYDPTVAAQVEAYVNYVCPVKGAAEALKAKSPAIANNPLIFPPADIVARLHQFRVLDANEETAWNDAFSKVMGT